MRAVRIKIPEPSTDTARVLGLELAGYDIPRSASSCFDESTGILRIDFEYIDTEPEREAKLTDHVSVRLGRNSGKILGLVIEAKKHGISEVRVSISNALEEVDQALGEKIPHLKRFNQQANYRLVKSVLNQNSAIVAQTAAAF